VYACGKIKAKEAPEQATNNLYLLQLWVNDKVQINIDRLNASQNHFAS
jgi:hypothetical protein